MITQWIIVGGCPRSGTTMMGNILGADEDAIVTPEAQFASDTLLALKRHEIPATAEAVGNYIANHWRFSIWEMPFPQSFYDLDHPSDPYELASQALKHVVESYAAMHGKPDARIWIDHTPGHLAALPIIEKTLFKHSAIHLIRDGRAIASSLDKVDWGPTNIIAAADWWTRKVSEGLAVQQFISLPTVAIRYEDILQQPHETLKKICTVLELDYHDDMLDSTALAVPRYTQSQHQAVGKGIQAKRAEAWRDELPKRDQEIFEALAGELLEILGYPRLYESPKPPKYYERAWLELFRHPLQRRAQRRRNRARRQTSLTLQTSQ